MKTYIRVGKGKENLMKCMFNVFKICNIFFSHLLHNFKKSEINTNQTLNDF